jgi:hypothetical protein
MSNFKSQPILPNNSDLHQVFILQPSSNGKVKWHEANATDYQLKTLMEAVPVPVGQGAAKRRKVKTGKNANINYSEHTLGVTTKESDSQGTFLEHQWSALLIVVQIRR